MVLTMSWIDDWLDAIDSVKYIFSTVVSYKRSNLEIKTSGLKKKRNARLVHVTSGKGGEGLFHIH